MKLLRLAFILLIISLTGCNMNDEKDSIDSELQIYTSIYPIEYIVEQIAGDVANVDTVYPPGVDAHTFEPSSKDITKIAGGDALIYLGAGMESFVETTAEALASQDIQFIELGQYPDLFSKAHEEDDHDHEHGHDHGDVDPHIWLDPLRMIDMANIVTDELTELSPNHEQLFNTNLDEFKKDMEVLNQNFVDTINNKSNKTIIVTHAAYGYWEERYGIEQIAINGLSSSDEPSQKDLTIVATMAKENNLNYVIFEKNSSNRVAEIIQDYIGAERLYIHNLEVLTEADIENGEDYLSLMTENLQVLDQATK